MTPEQIELARHALGLTRQKTSFRNAFVCGPGHRDFENWQKMVEAGDAKRRNGGELFSGDFIFRLTQAGAEKALRLGERLCAEDFPQ